MKIKKFFALLLAMTLCMGAFSVNAYAYVDENARNRIAAGSGRSGAGGNS